MIEGITTFGSNNLINEIKHKEPVFVCTIGTTDTSLIPEISGAGASPELTLYTPAGDAEYLVTGKVLCTDNTAETVVNGTAAPTPARLTKASILLADIPTVIVNAGSKIKPQINCNVLTQQYGKDIRTGKAIRNPLEIFENGRELGMKLSAHDYLVIGESVAAGTTTALGVLKALGYEANEKVSGSMPHNPHDLKIKTVEEGLKNAGITPGKTNAANAIAAVGDPTIPAIAGIVLGSKIPIILAGGTQMAGICAVIKDIDPNFDFSRINIATTVFVAEDESADLFNLLNQIDPNITVHIVNPNFENSTNEGLKNYTKGFVKEGVGAGGAMFTALIRGNNVEKLRTKIEKICE